jgi:hypothetical protein
VDPYSFHAEQEEKVVAAFPKCIFEKEQDNVVM